MTPSWITVAIVTCAILSPHSHARIPEVARIEAQAFLENASPHVPLELLMGVAWTESRFGPVGSRVDRTLGMFGVLQLLSRELICRGRDGYDDERRCSPDTLARRAELFDPARNIELGARQLEHRWRRAGGRWAPPDWYGAYYTGHVPRRGEDRRQFDAYVRRVRGSMAYMRSRLEACRDDADESGAHLGVGVAR